MRKNDVKSSFFIIFNIVKIESFENICKDMYKYV